ncbi:abc transporter [Trichococcus palustris]|uniref:Abc transporter n=1 Tax=Trichococcus palustris TaxID=140314 RepID=A0A143Y6V0_9LACT|nr:ABC transporter ATP-binding protein [Trichococcus palustris]CZQ83257.1 abc transporter [Trichococcus palustris]SFK69409.1 simple sugar transport system ATP-binding protein [Trichococcus palustris]
MTEENYVIEMRGVTKAFGSYKANDDIYLSLKKGEIHALLGENGAGKSTLMNILSGLLEPTSGTIKVNGQEVRISSPGIADKLGIGMVHQHFMLVKDFTVTENIILGSEPSKWGILNRKAAKSVIEGLSNKYHLAVDPSAKVEDITVGMQQRVEILKTLYRGADILIFDEPTAVLTPQEIEELMSILKEMTKEGKSIILITHKLDEIKAVADRCTVIRKGKSIGTVNVKETSQQELADMMVGRSVLFRTEKKAAEPKQAVLEIENVTVKESRGLEAVRGLNLTVRAGEIVGIAGIDGNGQSELIQAITGLRKVESGTIKLNGEEITNLAPRKITESGLGHIPEDRQRFGLILPMRLDENIALQSYYHEPFSRNGFLDETAIANHALELIKEFDVRTQSEKSLAGSLSGGNQQKAIIAREVDRDPSLLIAAQPTRGLDVGAIEFIHKRLIEQRDHDKAVLLMSFELDEILNLSDIIAVMYEGRIVAQVRPEDTSEQELGLLMAGSSLGKARAELEKSREEGVSSHE